MIASCGIPQARESATGAHLHPAENRGLHSDCNPRYRRAIDSQNRFHLAYTSVLPGGMSVQYNVMRRALVNGPEVEVEGPTTTRTNVSYDIVIGVGSDDLPVFGFLPTKAPTTPISQNSP